MGKHSRKKDSSSSTDSYKHSQFKDDYKEKTLTSISSKLHKQSSSRRKAHRKEKAKHTHKDKHKKHKHKDDKKKNTKTKKNEKIPKISWGKYGQIQESDLWKKRQEFQLWLLEVKKRDLESLQNWEEKALFRDFMEDFNTATLPHKKYYDLEKWEKKEANQMPQSATHQMPTNFNDEKLRMQEIKKLRDKRAVENLKAEFTVMKEDFDKVEAMKNQKLLQQRKELLFKMGRVTDAQKLQDLLKPDI